MFKKLLSKFLTQKITKGLDISEPAEFDDMNYPDDDPALYQELKKGYSSLKAKQPNDYILNMISSAFYGDDLWGEHLFDGTEHEEDYRGKINIILTSLQKIKEYHRRQEEFYHDNYITDPNLEPFKNFKQYMANCFQSEGDIKSEVDFIMDFRRSIAILHK